MPRSAARLNERRHVGGGGVRPLRDAGFLPAAGFAPFRRSGRSGLADSSSSGAGSTSLPSSST